MQSKALTNKEVDGVGSPGVGQRKYRIINNQNYCARDGPSLGFSDVSNTYDR